jgi:acyl carrier protein
VADVRAELLQCFKVVFPGLSEQQIATASPATVARWDSIATVTLFTVVDETFGINLDLADLDDFVSFDSILHCVEKAHAQSRE